MLNQEELLRKLVTIATTEHRAIGNERIEFSTDNIYTLTVPIQAKYALLQLEEIGSTGTSKVIRCWEDGSNPTTEKGFPKGDMDVWDIQSYSNLKDFKAVRITTASHILTVQYYS